MILSNLVGICTFGEINRWQSFKTPVSNFIKCWLQSATNFLHYNILLMMYFVSRWCCGYGQRLTLCRVYSLGRCYSGFCSTARLHWCNLMDGRLPDVPRCSGSPDPGPPTTHWPPHSFQLAHTEASQSGPPETSGTRHKEQFKSQRTTELLLETGVSYLCVQ